MLSSYVVQDLSLNSQGSKILFIWNYKVQGSKENKM